MPIIIDGWNFIRTSGSPLKNQEPLAALRSLITLLKTFQVRHSDPIMLVLDSSSEFLDIPYRNSPKLKIVPAKNADNFIKHYLDKIPANQRKNYRVVSSDLDVFDYSRQLSATAIKCADFWPKILKDN